MVTEIHEGYISGYKYGIVEVNPDQYVWWVERPGAIACWKGNVHSVPATVEEAKEQITETIATYPTKH